MALHLRRSATTKHLLRNPSGHLTTSDCPPAVSCALGTSYSPCDAARTAASWTATFSGVSVNTGCFYDSGASAYFKTLTSDANINSTKCLNYNSTPSGPVYPGLADWELLHPAGYESHSNDTCTALTGGSSGDVTMTRWYYSSVVSAWRLQVYMASAINNRTWVYFRGQISTAECITGGTMNNLLTTHHVGDLVTPDSTDTDWPIAPLASVPDAIYMGKDGSATLTVCC